MFRVGRFLCCGTLVKVIPRLVKNLGSARSINEKKNKLETCGTWKIVDNIRKYVDKIHKPL